MASKKNIVELETEFWNAIRDRDTKSAVALMTDPCTSPARKASCR